MAKLTFMFGAMNSRKSLDLLATAYNFEEKNIPFIALKSSLDTRDEGVIRSRAGLERKCTIVTPDVNIYEAIHQYNNVLAVQGGETLKWILVDECQFLTEEQIDQLSDIVDYMNITVMCYGLRTDFKSHLFPASKRLFEIADNIEEIKSSCECGKKSIINARFDNNNNVVTEGSQILVGGNDIYQPLCRKCWKEKIRESKKVMK
jgi:thymidine kinase